ncbi:MAG: endonuclease [Acholeplasmatales bacterium]|nr:endonuclease [Acholeplasmatales bacterium]
MPTKKKENYTSNSKQVQKRPSTKKSSTKKVVAAAITASVVATAVATKRAPRKKKVLVFAVLLLLLIVIMAGGLWWYFQKTEVYFLDESQIEYLGTGSEEYFHFKEEVRFKQSLQGKLPAIDELIEESDDYDVKWYGTDLTTEYTESSTDVWEHKVKAPWNDNKYTLVLVAFFFEKVPTPLPTYVEPPLVDDELDQYPAYTGDYYDGITPTVNNLYNRLHIGFTATRYDDAGKYGMLLNSDNPVADIVDNFDSNKNGDFTELLDLVYGIYDEQGFSLTWGNGKNYEREHVWCNARLGMARVTGSGRNQASDLHNLRAIGGVYTGTINQKRSDRYFVDDYHIGNEESAKAHIVGKDAFYPGLLHVGDVARILLYQYVMYKNILKIPTSENQLIGYTAYSPEGSWMPIWSANNLEILALWNALDPVDDFEEHRNDVIFAYQGNRNPFIDNNSWFNIIISELGLGGV